MKNKIKKFLSCTLAGMLAIGGAVTLGACKDSEEGSAGKEYTVALEDNGALIANKGMGWNFGYYSNSLDSYGDTVGKNNFLDDFPCDIVYFRMGWSYFQPDQEYYDNVLKPICERKNIPLPDNYEAGKDSYLWTILDDVLDGWIENGKRVAFRITVNDGWGQCTPLWLKELGAEGVEYDPITEGSADKFLTADKDTDKDGVIEDGERKEVDVIATEPYTKVGNFTEAGYEKLQKTYNSFTTEGKLWYSSNGEPLTNANGKKTWVPKYDDPIFLEYYEKFMETLRDRYSEHIEFIERGSFGTWGEGHSNRSLPTAGYLTPEAAEAHIDLYHRVFGDDYTVLTFDYVGDKWPELSQKCIDYGFGVTDDSLQVPGSGVGANTGVLLDYAYAGRYVGLETHPDTIATKVYYDGINDAYTSYARLLIDPEEQKMSDYYEAITLRMGYRINFTQAKISNFNVGSTAKVALEVKNIGAAPCYVGGNPTIIVKDESMNEVARGTSSFNLKDLKIADTVDDVEFLDTESCEVEFELPDDMAKGKYYVFLCVTDEDGEIFMNLPLDDGYNKQYRIATFELK